RTLLCLEPVTAGCLAAAHGQCCRSWSAAQQRRGQRPVETERRHRSDASRPVGRATNGAAQPGTWTARTIPTTTTVMIKGPSVDYMDRVKDVDAKPYLLVGCLRCFEDDLVPGFAPHDKEKSYQRH